METVVYPVLKDMAERQALFAGLLYVGLCLTAQGPRVIEFNVRFGDPEAQVLLPLLKTSPYETFLLTATGILAGLGALQWHDRSAVTVVLACKGYPQNPSAGNLIIGVDGPGYLHAAGRVEVARPDWPVCSLEFS